MPNVKKRISWHLTDLLGRDINVCDDVIKWLAPTPSEVDQRKVNKRLMARYAAAKMIKAAVEEGNSGLFTHILDRTEGKVADRLIADHTKTVNIRIELAHSQDTLPSHVIDGEEVARNALDQQSSSAAREEARVGTGDTLLGPITRGSEE